MTTTVLLLLLHVLALSLSAPDPDTHVHVHLPGSDGEQAEAGSGKPGKPIAILGQNGGAAKEGTRIPIVGDNSDTGAAAGGEKGTDYSDYENNKKEKKDIGADEYGGGVGGGSGDEQMTIIGGRSDDPLYVYIDANKVFDGNTDVKCGMAMTNFHGDEIIGGRTAEPNAFPWMVRIEGGCTERGCGGTLITSKHILTAYYCATKKGETTPCDHSDENRMAILGSNERDGGDDNNPRNKIPIIDVKFPEGAGFDKDTDDRRDHSFAMYILKMKVQFGNGVAPICLPPQGKWLGGNYFPDTYGGEDAVAAGWGMYATQNDGRGLDWTKEQSPLLKRVNLRVSKHIFDHIYMFGTKIEGPGNTGGLGQGGKKGEIQEPCAGDGGGPLMKPINDKWILIGTLFGGGYNCKTNETMKFEDEEVGIWNKVPAWTNWILKMIKENVNRGQR